MGSNHLKIKLTDTTVTLFYKLYDKYIYRIIYAHPDKLINKYIVKSQKQYEKFISPLYEFDGDMYNLNKELENFKPVYDDTNSVIIMLMELLACKCDVIKKSSNTIMDWFEKITIISSQKEVYAIDL